MFRAEIHAKLPRNCRMQARIRRPRISAQGQNELYKPELGASASSESIAPLLPSCRGLFDFSTLLSAIEF